MSKAKKNRNRQAVQSFIEPESECRQPVSEPEAVARGPLFGYLSYCRNHLWAVALIAFLSIGAIGAVLKYLDEDAQKQKLLAAKDRSALSRLNPFLAPPTATPTPQLKSEYLYAGSRLLAVEDANANVAPPSDLAVFRPDTGVWWIINAVGNYAAIQFGTTGDQPVPGDFDGDGKTDLSIFRPDPANQWWIYRSSDNSSYAVPFGSSSTDKTAPADYDGDGKTDIAVYRPSNGTWYILQSSTGTVSYPQFGNSYDVPAAADYDGDGKADLGVWRTTTDPTTTNVMYSSNSSNGALQYYQFSGSSTQVVSCDYDGDGKADYAVRSGANWLIKYSSTGATDSVPWQLAGDTPVQNDFDGDGKCDIAVWRPTDSPAGTLGNWFIRQSASNNSLRQQAWGTTNDIPVPAYYRR
jgi:hypothetical protein